MNDDLTPVAVALAFCRIRGIWWGRHNENGIWLATKPRRRFLTPLSQHDSFYIAIWRLRARLVVRNTRKP